MDIPSIILARQPIFDRHQKVFEYELLFRDNISDVSANIAPEDGDIATTRVINHTFLELGVERVIGDNIAFVNLTRSFILSDDPLPFAQDRVVLEILEDIVIDAELLAGVQKLIDQGYTIALDDFVFHESLRPLLGLAKIVKVDILALSDADLASHVTLLSQYPVTLLAEKVETRSQFVRCMALGFEYFQGYFFCRPDIITDKPIPDNKLKLLALIEKLQNPDVQFDDIEAIISQDPMLSYKLLRLLNSAAIGIGRSIDSLHRGLIILGLKAIKTWATLIMVAEMHALPAELFNNALIRAKMCENLAQYYDCAADSGFLVGLFSLIDAMLDKPMHAVIDTLPFSMEIRNALLEREGRLGKLLNDVRDYEQGHWAELEQRHDDFAQLGQAYIEATEWTINAKLVI
ncbi:putative signal transduction protein [Methylophaga frappieri]|uniref:Putative signal transduction protein n=1 Tax=Methylophaga frappieri (strain ATCC BAA-2434 / DSM 25690 / JAM7) TaxID=754477 RepID=I1YHE7_METFJ|nr:HDOD domain-containing protein [Methylophaga frappieri]AFJ02340.1 putative signal transduction protein [Methylophaga frappieri]